MQELTEEVDGRRRDLRFPILIRQIRLEGGNEVFFGYATNLSISGIYVQTINPKPPGARVTIRFNLPKDPNPIDCVGEVVWHKDYDSVKCRRPGMGLRFVEVSEQDRDRLCDFLLKRDFERDLDIIQKGDGAC